jgi:hypothetical protein
MVGKLAMRLKQFIDDRIEVSTGWDDGLEESSDLVEGHEEKAIVVSGDDDPEDEREISDDEEEDGGNNDEDDPDDEDDRDEDNISDDDDMLDCERIPPHQFKASRHWRNGFLRRNGLAIRKPRTRRRAIVDQAAAEKFTSAFPGALERYPPDRILNCDETGCENLPGSLRTIAGRGAEAVRLISTRT